MTKYLLKKTIFIVEYKLYNFIRYEILNIKLHFYTISAAIPGKFS